ncbi:MAG: GNAT family N-acetyltransferase [Cyclobacteriaceae bacterium]|nr:GNAT family N-acetyltransferase [Cyclobacteriaceae bacterium]
MKLSLPVNLETERLLLQRLRYEDADEIFHTYASKPEATAFVSWPTHRSIRDTRAFLRMAIPAWEAGIDYSYSIRWKDTHRFAGSLGAINDQGKIQFGYVLGPTHWGRGVATEAVTALLAQLRQQPDIYRVGTFVDTENVASIRVLEKCGLQREATLPEWFRFVNQGNRPKDCALFRLSLSR